MSTTFSSVELRMRNKLSDGIKVMEVAGISLRVLNEKRTGKVPEEQKRTLQRRLSNCQQKGRKGDSGKPREDKVSKRKDE